jgi:hypothetical protein
VAQSAKQIPESNTEKGTKALCLGAARAAKSNFIVLKQNQLKGGSHVACVGGDSATNSSGLVAVPFYVLGAAAWHDVGRTGVGTLGNQHHWLAAE